MNIFDSYGECLRTLNKLIHLFPNNLLYYYNLATTKEHMAVELVSKENKTTGEIEQVKSDFAFAKGLFISVKEITSKMDLSKIIFTPTHVDLHIRFCERNMNLAKDYLNRESTNEKRLNEEKQRKMVLNIVE